jgi:type IX secretion system substrate protein
MKRKKQFLALGVIVLLLGLTADAYSQAWTFRGFVTGAGTFPSISVYGPNSIMIFGGPSGTPYVAKSTNGGTTFTVLGTSGISLELYCGWTVDDNTIYAGDGGSAGGAGGNARVYKTTNGGTLWTTILSTGGSFGFINGIVFSRTSTSVGVAQSDPPNNVGNPYWIAKTTDNGLTWPIQNPPSISGAASAQNSIMCIDNLFYGFGLNAGASRVDLTTDGGTTWNVRSLIVAGSFISGFAASSDKQYLIAASNTSLPNIARSTNGGLSFSTVNIGLSMGGYCTMKWVYGTSICYLSSGTGAAGCIARSTDNGATWQQIATASITGITHMELVYVGGVVYGYAVAGDGSVIGGVNPVGIDPNNQNVPSEYSLEQNYPNPFNPTTTIKYSIPQASHVTLKIYDMLGNEVMSVVNENQTVGNYVETIDASSLSSGVYFYKLTAGTFTESKKMSVVK